MVTERRVATQDRGRETQLKVINGAATVFEKYGYGLASMRAIAEESGISTGSIVFHFRTKDQIALAVLQEQHARSIAKMTEVAQERETTIERLVYVSRAVADQLLNDTVVRAGIALTLEEIEFGESTSSFYDDWIKAIELQLGPALASGELMSNLDAADLAESYIGFFTGVQLLSRVRSGWKGLLQAVSNLWFAIIDSLVPPESRDSAHRVIREAFADPATVGA